VDLIIFTYYLYYYRFPKDVALRQKWMDSLGLAAVSNWHQLCSKQFDVNCFKNINGDKCKLWRTAVPSLCTIQFEVVHHNYIPVTIDPEESIVNIEKPEENINIFLNMILLRMHTYCIETLFIKIWLIIKYYLYNIL